MSDTDPTRIKKQNKIAVFVSQRPQWRRRKKRRREEHNEMCWWDWNRVLLPFHFSFNRWVGDVLIFIYVDWVFCIYINFKIKGENRGRKIKQLVFVNIFLVFFNSHRNKSPLQFS
jgi:phosphatidylserine decarboxylase